MFYIYIDSPVPNLKDIKEDFLSQLSDFKSNVPDFQEYIDTLANVSLPPLFGLPSPIFPDYSNIPEELMEVVDAIKYQVDTLTMMGIFKPLASVIGGSLDNILPKIPTLNVSILDIVNGNIQPLQEVVTNALKNGISLPYVPTQLFENYSNYAKESVLALKMILIGYKELLLDTMQGMIKSVMNILKVSGTLPTLPLVPSIDQLKQTVLTAFPEYSTWYELITNVDMSKIMNIFGLGDFTLPETSFIPNYSNYEQHLIGSFNQIKDHYLSMGLKMLVDFIENTLGVLGISFPPFCIGF